MKLQRYERTVEKDTLYIVVSVFKDCTVEEALQIVQDNRQMPFDNLLETEFKTIDNKVFITETFIHYTKGTMFTLY